VEFAYLDEIAWPSNLTFLNCDESLDLCGQDLGLELLRRVLFTFGGT